MSDRTFPAALRAVAIASATFAGYEGSAELVIRAAHDERAGKS